ncbi:MAG: hypothetical protein ABI461_22345, partial [Polyangiaceae bacterium]
MILKKNLIGTLTVCTLTALIALASCAKGNAADEGSGNGPGGRGSGGDGGLPVACPTCDTDGDGVADGSDKCPGTPAGAKVNGVGCADSQLTAEPEPIFPSYGLTWTPGGDLGRTGGLTWAYSGINRGDLFHIYWII